MSNQKNNKIHNYDCSVIINGKEYFIQKPVLDLLLITSQERDYYRDLLEKLSEHNK